MQISDGKPQISSDTQRQDGQAHLAGGGVDEDREESSSEDEEARKTHPGGDSE